MSERVMVRMNKRFETGFWSVNPERPEADDYQPVERLHELNPYGMLLTSIASCTAQVVLTYAQHHDIPLEEVELHEAYHRDYQDDCDNCEDIDSYDEHILEQIAFIGDLDASQREKLFKIAHQCPIVKMFESGIPIQTELLEHSGSFSNKIRG